MVGVPITSYEYSTNGGSTWTTAPSNPFTVSGYGNNANVSVLVRAKNPIGAGDSTSGSGVTANVPSAPSLSMTDTGTTVDWSWTEPSNGGLAITNYEYSISTNNGTYPGNSSTTSLGYPSSISNTRNTSYYKLKVRAVNAAGPGPYSESANSTAWALTSETKTVSETGQNEACTSTGCGTCGCQGRERSKTRSKNQRKDTYTRAGIDDVVDWYDTSSYPEWSTISFGSCYNIGSCSETTSNNNYEDLPEVDWGTAINTGMVVYVGWYTGGPENEAYRYASPVFGWYVSDSAGNATVTCAGGSGLLVSDGIKHCNICGNDKYIPYGATCSIFSCC